LGRAFYKKNQNDAIKHDGFVKSSISALRAIPQNFTYAKYAAFFGIAQALILNFLQSRQIVTFYECIKHGAPMTLNKKMNKKG